MILSLMYSLFYTHQQQHRRKRALLHLNIILRKRRNFVYLSLSHLFTPKSCNTGIYMFTHTHYLYRVGIGHTTYPQTPKYSLRVCQFSHHVQVAHQIQTTRLTLWFPRVFFLSICTISSSRNQFSRALNPPSKGLDMFPQNIFFFFIFLFSSLL